MGLLYSEMQRAFFVAVVLILYGLCAWAAVDTIGQPIETMNTGLLLVSGLMTGLSAGLLLMVLTMPTVEQFDEKARELGYTKDKEKGA